MTHFCPASNAVKMEWAAEVPDGSWLGAPPGTGAGSLQEPLLQGGTELAAQLDATLSGTDEVVARDLYKRLLREARCAILALGTDVLYFPESRARLSASELLRSTEASIPF